MRRLFTFMAMLVVVAAFGAASVQAQSIYSDTYIVPVASHTNGQNGTLWMSDMAIHNISATPMTVQLVFIETGENTADNVFPLISTNSAGSAVVAANGSVLLSDVLNGYRGQQFAAGAILVGGDRPFVMTSRSYSMSPSGNTIGQTVQPARDFISNLSGTSDNTALAQIPGLINNNQFRTNLGFVAANGSASSAPMVVTITMRGGDGQVIGTRDFTVAAGTIEHLQFGSRSVSDRTFDIGSAEVRIKSGSGAVVPYASVIDNGTADAVFILGQFPLNSGATTSSSQPSLFRQWLDRFAVSVPR
jgi:hypothetical protein